MAKSKQAFLSISQGSKKGQRFLLDLATISIGRDPNNSIPLRDIEASRLHAQIHKKGNTYKVVDLNSSNGLFVNKVRVKTKTLKHGDLVRIGKSEFRFEIEVVTTDSNIAEDSVDSMLETRLVPLQKRLDVFVNISQAISQTRNLDELLKKILRLIFEWTQADRACILLDEGANYRVVSSIGRKGELKQRINISRTILNLAKSSLEAVAVSGSGDELREAKSILGSGINEIVCMPIAFRGQLRGFIYVDTLINRSTHSFGEEHVKLMAAVGQQTAVAIENHLYYARELETRQMAAVGEAMTGLSHHIKNILQGIHGGAHIVDKSLENGDPENMGHVAEGWAIVKRNQDKISELVLDMLSFGKVQDLDLRLVDLNAIVGKLVRTFESEFAAEPIQFNWTPNNAIDTINVDRKAITRAIENVVRNSIDACKKKESGQITLSIEKSESPPAIRISIEDDGCGIADENLPNIFSLFESTKGGRSTGIGLTVAQKLIREHNGDICVSTTVGVGSKFTIVLPCVDSKEPVTQTFKRMKP